MKQIILSATLIAASAMMISCEKENAPAMDDGRVRFTSGIKATSTRVAIDPQGESVWEQGDPVGIFMVRHATDVVAEGAANIKYTASAAGASTGFAPAADVIYYPINNAVTVDFIAYHPHKEAASGFAYPVDVSDQTSQTAIDLLWAKADKGGEGYNKEDSRQGTVVNFTFDHQLVKLVMKVTKGAGVPDDLPAVSINGMYTRAAFDLKGIAGITGASDLKSFAPCTLTAGTRYEAILLPAQSLGAGHTVIFRYANGEVYTWKMHQQIPELEAGKMYEYEVAITKHGVDATGTINNWTVGSTGSGVAE